ncbi:hypothetical protein J2S13_001011 [Oikeobacillus pervagus]|uniref:DUF3918 domain-containing protein n=1 Tax=Oikeobacillus pervagus TaxID=1325931 RepID=A0AAJ1SXQ1_9BACI|nr:YrzQ family protein [Oikeobacillus pervagus]MDQ0214615.1 hypothetical protein [Oikeobacillus pervagus]
MNKTISSLIGIGAGIAAVTMMNRSNKINKRQMRRWTKQIQKMF